MSFYVKCSCCADINATPLLRSTFCVFKPLLFLFTLNVLSKCFSSSLAANIASSKRCPIQLLCPFCTQTLMFKELQHVKGITCVSTGGKRIRVDQDDYPQLHSGEFSCRELIQIHGQVCQRGLPIAFNAILSSF